MFCHVLLIECCLGLDFYFNSIPLPIWLNILFYGAGSEDTGQHGMSDRLVGDRHEGTTIFGDDNVLVFQFISTDNMSSLCCHWLASINGGYYCGYL